METQTEPVAAHTPGPWVFESKRDEGDNIFTQRKPQMRIANVYGDCSVEPYQDNARLIAAAPDLLTELQGLLEGITALINESEGVVGYHLNGDVAPWGELEEGGRYECLTHLKSSATAIAKALGK